eukprot:1179420-Prorocentrum_minimum.AAC.4
MLQGIEDWRGGVVNTRLHHVHEGLRGEPLRPTDRVRQRQLLRPQHQLHRRISTPSARGRRVRRGPPHPLQMPLPRVQAGLQLARESSVQSARRSAGQLQSQYS